MAEPWIGVSYRPKWRREIMAHPPELDCLEIIAEHFLDVTPERRADLGELSARYPLLPHGLGLSFGTDAPLDPERLDRVGALLDTIRPPFFSEHLSFSSVGGLEVGHLTPLPRTRDAVRAVVRNVRLWRDTVGIPLLLENITYDLALPGDYSDGEFLTEVLDRADCWLLLDLHNLYTNAWNHGFDARAFLEEIPLERVRAVHLGGGFHEADGHRVDSHSGPVPEEVWNLLRAVAPLAPLQAVILEWDADLPAYSRIAGELDATRAIVHPVPRSV